METNKMMNRVMTHSGLKCFLEKTTLVKNAIIKRTMVLAALVIMVSCDKSEKPEIGSFELGYENSKIAYVGADLHMDAEVVAEGTIDRIHIVIHPEGEHARKGVRSVLDEGEWEVDTTYTKFSGLKNTTFHEHIEIAVDAEPGDYHFHFEVTDMEGYQTVYEEEFQLLISETK
jgi:hypothetical protein